VPEVQLHAIVPAINKKINIASSRITHPSVRNNLAQSVKNVSFKELKRGLMEEK